MELRHYETDELIEELEKRKIVPAADAIELLKQIYQLRRNNQPYQRELDQLIYSALGRIA